MAISPGVSGRTCHAFMKGGGADMGSDYASRAMKEKGQARTGGANRGLFRQIHVCGGAMKAPFEVLVDRIENLAVDAVVNAANQLLAPGTGVDGALRAAAGPELTALTRQLGPVKVGQAVITPGFNLKARHIIHTV